MSGAVRAYIDRSMNVLKRNTAKVMRMDGTNQPPPLPLLTFSSSSASASSSRLTPISSLATGSDADIGGLSTCTFTPQPEPRAYGQGQAAEQQQEHPQTHVAMHGNLSLAVPPAYAGRIRTGYAAFRTKTRPSLFGEETWDLSLYSHLRMKVAYRGLEGWRDRWYVNIQTDGPVQSDLFQHRLHLPPTSSSPSSSSSTSLPSSPSDGPAPTFHTVHLPLSSFLLTNSGKTSSTQLPMMRERVRTIGISLLGGGRSTEDAPPVPASSFSSAVAAPSAGTFAEAQRLAAGGWKGGADAGKGGKEVYVDEEMEALMRSDLPAGAQLPGRIQQQQQQPQSQQAVSRPSATGGYHRLGSASLPQASAGEVPPVPIAEGTPEEGYFELSIKSVEAVRWDPEAEDGPAE